MKRTATVMLLVAASALPLAAQTAPPKHPSRSRITPQAVSEQVNWTSGVSYTYDGAGNVIAIGADKFVYDDVGRLVQAVVTSKQRNYTYDAFGNRKTCTLAGGGDCQYGVVEISDKNRMTLATYDPQGSGNVTKFGPHNYSYDAVNMMTRDEYGIETADFIYTADDERIAVYAPAKKSWQWTVRDTGNKVLREFTSEDGAGVPGTSSWKWAKDYVWRDGMLLASRQPQEQNTFSTFHYHLDHLGTPRRITDQKDAIVGSHDYFAFGPEVSGGTHESPRTDLKYTAHERDRHSEPDSLDYMHARSYNFSVARFLTPDPLLSVRDEIANPQLWNRYAYVLNSPVDAKDPDGREVKATFYMRSGVLVVKDLDAGGKTMRLEGVFSGTGRYVNDADAAGVGKAGPIPPGKYLIGTAWNHLPGSPGNYMWYRLWGWNEQRRGYFYFPPGVEVRGPGGVLVERSVMNLHTGLSSIGCLTVPSDIPHGQTNYPQSAQYDQLRKMLDNTTPLLYKGSNFTGTLYVVDEKEPLMDRLLRSFGFGDDDDD